MSNIHRINIRIKKDEFKRKLGIKDGNNYILTQKDKDDIARLIKVPIEKREKIIQQIIKEVNISETALQIKDKLESLKGNRRLDFSAIKNFPDLTKYLSLLGQNRGGSNLEAFLGGKK